MDFLFKEDGSYLLQENSSKLILDEIIVINVIYVGSTPSQPVGVVNVVNF